ncbi:MAG: hypothetical protein LQ344_007465 [Seirophora lacunosa]|nr:MAG: hypothetical protein LQ344_007465 [Seirophora lacunosa]
MLRNIKQPKVKKPVMVMLHGSGSSGAIFAIQTHLLAKELSKTYDLVYIDAPTASEPGPGVLPLFAGMPGYYRWLAPELPTASTRLAELSDLARYIETQLDSQNINPKEVVAFVGFSQGALVALALLGLQLVEQSTWENLRFSVAIGAGTSGNTAQMDGLEKIVRKMSTMLGRQDGKFPGHSVQAMAIRDSWYEDGRRLASMCARDTTKTMDYRDGHVVPRQKTEVLKLVQMIRNTDEASKPPSSETQRGWNGPFYESIPSPLDSGGNITGGLAVLAASLQA